MKNLKRLTFLTAPVVAMIGLSGVANAAPVNTAASNIAHNREVALAKAESVAANLTVHPAVVSWTNFISNGWTGGLGVIHVKDGAYTHGSYDALLPAHKDTVDAFEWSTTAGWYTGPGYCTLQLRSDNGGAWVQQSPDLGSGQHFIGAYTSYIVVPYAC